MRLVRGIHLGAALIVTMGLLLAFGSIAVFARMTPAIAVILEENDRSLEACERMLAALATQPRPGEDPGTVAAFEAALAAAKGNVTEAAEEPILAEIERTWQAERGGDPAVRPELVDAIGRLAAVNRRVMRAADARAADLGRAGGWSVAFMASITLVVFLVLLRSLDVRVLGPIQEIRDVVSARRGGDRRRRCSLPDAESEVRALGRDLNAILDELDGPGESPGGAPAPAQSTPSPRRSSRGSSKLHEP